MLGLIDLDEGPCWRVHKISGKGGQPLGLLRLGVAIQRIEDAREHLARRICLLGQTVVTTLIEPWDSRTSEFDTVEGSRRYEGALTIPHGHAGSQSRSAIPIYPAWMTHIVGQVDLSTVMAHLSSQRPVFHSEADFQFAFAQSVASLDPTVGIRLEVPKRGERRTYVDLACRAANRTSLVEFKYVTRAWTGTDGLSDETFDLRGHEALDLARLNFVHDVWRLEGWARDLPRTDGFAIFLTNDNRLWEEPQSMSPTRDQAFRIHHGRTLSGQLTWGTEDSPFPANDRLLVGSYAAEWSQYSVLDGKKGGELRWLGWHIAGSVEAPSPTVVG